MIYKILLTFILLTSANLFARESSNPPSLENLDYMLVQSLDPKIGEPSRYYKFSIHRQNEDTPGTIVVRKMNGTFVNYPVFIKKDGSILTPDKQYEQIMGFDGGYAEKFELLLVANNKYGGIQPLAKCVLIPFPRILKDKAGHKVVLNVESGDGHQFTFTGSGFPASKQMIVKSRSCHESTSFPLETDEKGNFIFGYSPAVVGRTEGPFELVFTAEDMTPLRVTHYWGHLAFYKPNAFKKLKDKYQFTGS
jgi:hypothetical protein